MKKNFHEILPKGTSCATEKSEMPILYFQNVRSKKQKSGRIQIFSISNKPEIFFFLALKNPKQKLREKRSETKLSGEIIHFCQIPC